MACETSVPKLQVGVTPEGIEVPRCTMDPTCVASVHQQPLEHRPTLPTGPDPKWRYFWRIGDRPADTDFAELNAEPVVPAGELLPGSDEPTYRASKAAVL